MLSRHAYTVAALCAIVFVSCGHFLVPSAFRPVTESYEASGLEGAHMEVFDDGTVAWIQGRLEVTARVMTDEELNRQFPGSSTDGGGPADELPTNVFTYGDWEDSRAGTPPVRFSVFKFAIKNYAYPKVKFDPLTVTIESGNGRTYHPWGRFDFVEFFRRFAISYNGIGYQRFKERLSILNRAMYPDDEFCFSGQTVEGFVVFPEIHTDVSEIELSIPSVGFRYNFRNEPVEAVALSFRFERDLKKVRRRDQVALAD